MGSLTQQDFANNIYVDIMSQWPSMREDILVGSSTEAIHKKDVITLYTLGRTITIGRLGSKYVDRL